LEGATSVQGSVAFAFFLSGERIMSSIAETLQKRSNAWWIALAGMAALIIVSSGISNLRRGSIAVNRTQELALPAPAAERGGVASYESGIHSEPTLLSAATDPAAMKAGGNLAIDRKMVRNSSVDLVVQKPAEAAEKIRELAEGLGGFLVSSQVSGGSNAGGAALTIRVPAARFEEARSEIRKLGLRVESEKVEAQDVTRQFVDEDANLRNLRAEEAQYLSILKQAHTVKDTLAVSEKLSDVRGQIEQQQAELNALAKQTETVAIAVSLRAEAEAQVFGLHWRPLYQMKLALRDGLDAAADYGVAMTSFLFYLPAVLLWMGTIVVGAAVGWKVVRWAGRVFFAWPKQTEVQGG
jgi:hypothetical protein